MNETIYFPVLYPMGSATFAIACSHCKNMGGGEVCTLCKQEKKSGFELETEPKGRWIEEYYTDILYCDNCASPGKGRRRTPYCPFCGAKMENAE